MYSPLFCILLLLFSCLVGMLWYRGKYCVFFAVISVVVGFVKVSNPVYVTPVFEWIFKWSVEGDWRLCGRRPELRRRTAGGLNGSSISPLTITTENCWRKRMKNKHIHASRLYFLSVLVEVTIFCCLRSVKNTVYLVTNKKCHWCWKLFLVKWKIILLYNMC